VTVLVLLRSFWCAIIASRTLGALCGLRWTPVFYLDNLPQGLCLAWVATGVESRWTTFALQHPPYGLTCGRQSCA